MKKIIYILTVVSLVLALVAIPTFAVEECFTKFHVLNSTSSAADNQFVTLYCHEIYPMSDKANIQYGSYLLPQSWYITTLTDVGVIEVWRSNGAVNEYDASNSTLVSRKLYNSFGDTYDVTPKSWQFYGEKVIFVRVLDLAGNSIPFIVTYIKGDNATASTYISNESSNLKTLAHTLTSCIDDGVIITNPQYKYTYYDCTGDFEFTLKPNEQFRIVIKTNPNYAVLNIYKNGTLYQNYSSSAADSFEEGTPYDVDIDTDTTSQIRITYESEESGAYGTYWVVKSTPIETSSSSYEDGYNDGYSQAIKDNPDGSYNDGYTAGYNQGVLDNANSGYQDGYNAGYNQALKDNPDDGNYNQGVTDGEANILNQMREYMILQGLNPQGNTVESLLSYYASVLNSNSNNNGNWQEGYDSGYDVGYSAGYSQGLQFGSSYGYEQARTEFEENYGAILAEKYNSGYANGYNVGLEDGKGMNFEDSYTDAFDKLKENIENSTNEIKGSIDETANGSFIQGFLAGMWNGMTGFISMILTGITFSGLSLMNILATAIGILVAAFIIKMIKG